MNILVVAPHPDDEVLGCGGVISRNVAENNNVYILVMTKGSPKLYAEEKILNVRREALCAHEFLGVKKTIFLDFHAPELDVTSVADIANSINKVVKEFSIEEMYIPHRGDIHADHRAVANACFVASRPVNNNTVKRLFAYETLSETEWAPPFGDDAFIPNHFVDVTVYFDDKLRAMGCYKSQLKQFPNPRSIDALTALAKFRGATVGVERAEAFMTIRTIV